MDLLVVRGFGGDDVIWMAGEGQIGDNSDLVMERYLRRHCGKYVMQRMIRRRMRIKSLSLKGYAEERMRKKKHKIYHDDVSGGVLAVSR
jgi:hypothetical protein